MITLADQSSLPPWPAWVWVALALAVIATIGYFARALRETGITDAAPAPQTPAVPERALTERQVCYQRGHVYSDWAKTVTHWVCTRCGDEVKRIDDDLPYDQDAALLVVEAEQWLRGAS